MDALSILSEFVDRVKTAKDTEQKAELAQWVTQNGLESLKPQLLAKLGHPNLGKCKREDMKPRDVDVIAKLYIVTFAAESASDQWYDLDETPWSQIPQAGRDELLAFLNSKEGMEWLKGYFQNHAEYHLKFKIKKITFEDVKEHPTVTVTGTYIATTESTATLAKVIGESIDHYFRAGDYNFTLCSLTFPHTTE